MDDQKTETAPPEGKSIATKKYLVESNVANSFEPYPSTEASNLSDGPVGRVWWGDESLDVWCAKHEDYEEAKRIAGATPWDVLYIDDRQKLAQVARLALGGDKCPLSVEQLLDVSFMFEVTVLRAAVTAFFWAGPVSRARRLIGPSQTKS